MRSPFFRRSKPDPTGDIASKSKPDPSGGTASETIKVIGIEPPQQEREPTSPRSGTDFPEEERNPLSAVAQQNEKRSDDDNSEGGSVVDIARGNGCRTGCQSGCSTGTETVTAFGEAVTEVFDLINEVAFPEVMDLARKKEEKKDESENDREEENDDDDDEDNDDNDDDDDEEEEDSYKDDDDSIFNRTDEYNHSKQVKEFLGFIGAVKGDNMPIISTPLTPPSLVLSNGMPLDLPMETSVLLDMLSRNKLLAAPVPTEEKVTAPTPEEEKTEAPKPKDEIAKGSEPKDEEYTCDRDENAQICGDDDDESVTKSQNSVGSIDRYSSIEQNTLSEDMSSEDDRDWYDKKTEGKYSTCLENVKNNKKLDTTKNLDESQGNFMPFAAIAHKFKNGFTKYTKTSSVVGEDQSELLTIVESSGEDTHGSMEEETASEQEKFHNQEKFNYPSDVEDIDAKASVVEDCRTETSGSSFTPYNNVEYADVDGDGDGDGDDRTYVSYAMSEDDSFFEMDDNSVTYSIAKDSLLDDSLLDDSLLEDSITNHSHSYVSEEYSDGSTTRNTEFTGSSGYGESATEGQVSSDADTTDWITDEEKTEPKKLQPQHTTVYDNLYPTDTLFSFPTKDDGNESLFDFSDSSNADQVNKEKSHVDGRSDPPTSVILDKPSVKTENENSKSSRRRVDALIKEFEKSGHSREKECKAEVRGEGTSPAFEYEDEQQNSAIEGRDGIITERKEKVGEEMDVGRTDNKAVSERPSLSLTMEAEAQLAPKLDKVSNNAYGSATAAEQGYQKNLVHSPRHAKRASRLQIYNQHKDYMRNRLQQKAE